MGCIGRAKWALRFISRGVEKWIQCSGSRCCRKGVAPFNVNNSIYCECSFDTEFGVEMDLLFMSDFRGGCLTV